MLLTHVLSPVRVPPEEGALIGAVDAVQGGDAPVLDGVVGLGAASGMEENGVVAIGQRDIVVPGRAHRTDFAHALHALEHPQHPGDAALGHRLIDDVCLGHPQLGQGLFQVVEHDGHRPVFPDVRGAALPREWVHIGQLGLRFRLHRGQGGYAGLLRRGGGGGRLLLGPAGAQGGQQQQRGDQFPQLVHLHGDSSLFGFYGAIIPSPPIFCQPKVMEKWLSVFSPSFLTGGAFFLTIPLYCSVKVQRDGGRLRED